jgi:DNA polymerase III delta subunit
MSTTSSDVSLPRVLVLAGDDTVGREQARVKMIKEVQRINGQYVLERYDQSMEDFTTYTEKIITPSLFMETRVFLICHAQTLNEKELKELDRTIKYPPPDSYIIIEVDESKKGKEAESKVVKVLQIKKRSADKGGEYAFQEFLKPPDYKIAEWLVNQVPQLLNRRISKANADLLVDLVGYEIDTLYSELQKIDIHLEPGESIEQQDIEEVVGSSRSMTVFELASALSARQLTRALTIVDSLFATTFYAPSMVTAVFRHFWALFRIRRFADTNPQVMKNFQNSKGFNNPVQTESAFAIGKAAGLLADGEQRKVYPVIIMSGIVPLAKKFTDEELKTICKWLLEFDVGIKTGKITGSQEDVQLFCYRIVRVSELLKDGVLP